MLFGIKIAPAFQTLISHFWFCARLIQTLRGHNVRGKLIKSQEFDNLVYDFRARWQPTRTATAYEHATSKKSSSYEHCVRKD